MLRCAISPAAPRASRLGWAVVTHSGRHRAVGPGGRASLARLLPSSRASRRRSSTLVISHLLVQLVKRTVGRGRPSIEPGCLALIREPDRFSFPSGHATASLAVALPYGVVFPLWAGRCCCSPWLVGFSRVRLGVHYPSDVLVGQAIAA